MLEAILGSHLTRALAAKDDGSATPASDACPRSLVPIIRKTAFGAFAGVWPLRRRQSRCPVWSAAQTLSVADWLEHHRSDPLRTLSSKLRDELLGLLPVCDVCVLLQCKPRCACSHGLMRLRTNGQGSEGRKASLCTNTRLG